MIIFKAEALGWNSERAFEKQAYTDIAQAGRYRGDTGEIQGGYRGDTGVDHLARSRLGARVSGDKRMGLGLALDLGLTRRLRAVGEGLGFDGLCTVGRPR